jgi:hypothetical protein
MPTLQNGGKVRIAEVKQRCVSNKHALISRRGEAGRKPESQDPRGSQAWQRASEVAAREIGGVAGPAQRPGGSGCAGVYEPGVGFAGAASASRKTARFHFGPASPNSSQRGRAAPTRWPPGWNAGVFGSGRSVCG